MEAENNANNSENALLNDAFLNDFFFADSANEIEEDHAIAYPYNTKLNPLIKAIGRYLVKEYKATHTTASLAQRQNILTATDDINKILANNPNKNQFSRFLIDVTQYLTKRFIDALQYAHENMTDTFINKTIEKQLDIIFDYSNPYLDQDDNLLNAKIKSGLQRTFKDISNVDKLSRLLEKQYQTFEENIIEERITPVVNINELAATPSPPASSSTSSGTDEAKKRAAKIAADRAERLRLAEIEKEQTQADWLFNKVKIARSMLLVKLEAYKFFQKIRGDLVIISKCYEAAFSVLSEYDIGVDHEIKIDSVSLGYLTLNTAHAQSPIVNMINNIHFVEAVVKEVYTIRNKFNTDFAEQINNGYKHSMHIENISKATDWAAEFKKVLSYGVNPASTPASKIVLNYVLMGASAKAKVAEVGEAKAFLNILFKINKNFSLIEITVKYAIARVLVEMVAARLETAKKSTDVDKDYGTNQSPDVTIVVDKVGAKPPGLASTYNTQLDSDKSIEDLWKQYDQAIKTYNQFFDGQQIKDIGWRAIFEEGIVSISGGDILFEAFTAEHQIDEGERIACYIRSKAYNYRKGQLSEIKTKVENKMGSIAGEDDDHTFFSELNRVQLAILNNTPLIDGGAPLKKQIRKVEVDSSMKKPEAKSVITAIDAAGKMMTDKMQEENTRMQDTTQMRNVAGETISKFIQKIFDICKSLLQ